MPMRIQMQGPAGTARVVLNGAKFGRATRSAPDLPQCRIVTLTEKELVVQSAAGDGTGAAEHFGIDVELLIEPYDDGTVIAQTNGPATLALLSPFDGNWKILGANQPETVLIQWIGFRKKIVQGERV